MNIFKFFFLAALMMALKLNTKNLIQEVVESIPIENSKYFSVFEFLFQPFSVIFKF